MALHRMLVRGGFRASELGLLFATLVLSSRAEADQDSAPEPAPVPQVATERPAQAALEQGTGFPAGWLAWSSPPECPGPEHVERRIIEWLGAPPPASPRLAVRSQVVWTEAGWEVRVVVQLGPRSGERRVRLESCRDAADFVALAVALAVNPGLDPGALSTAEWIEPARGSTAASETEDLSPFAPPPVKPAPPLPLPRDAAEEPGADSDDAPARLALFAGAGAEVSMGALPRVHGGIAGQVGVAWDRWQLWLGGRFLPSVGEEFEATAVPIQFSLLAAKLGGSLDFMAGPWNLGPLAAVELGTVQAGQTLGLAEPLEESAIWAALAVGLQAGLSIGDWLEPFASLELSIPLTRPRFVLDDGSLVHQSNVGFRAELGARVFFWTR